MIERPHILLDPADPFVTRTTLFGVEYAIQDLGTQGRLFLTPYGYPFRHLLHPDHWYTNKLFAKFGHRMPNATGTVYRMRVPPLPLTAPPYGHPNPPPLQRSLNVLIKFSRVGQPVPVWVSPSASALVSQRDVYAARFLGPFEEFGTAEALRHAPAPRDFSETAPEPLPRLRTKKPLAIYEPPQQFSLWQTGRIESDFLDSARRHRASLGPAADLIDTLDLHIDRDYLLLYAWVEGHHAQELHEAGHLSESDFLELVPQAAVDLAALGYRMLDIKPVHLILRKRRDGSLLRRHGRLVYVLVDYELIIRCAEV